MSMGMNTSEEDRILSFLPKNCRENPFTVPDDYFNSLQNEITTAVFVDDLKGKVLNDGFNVPQGYFNSLSERINNRLLVQPPAKINNIRRITTSWSKYAAAACFALVVGAAIFLNQKPANSSVDFNSIPDDEIVNYLKVNTETDDSDLLINNINMDKSFTKFDQGFSDSELEQYINSTTL